MTTHESNEEKVCFGYQEVPAKKKTQMVANVFHSVANKYDCMNDLMSFGLHRLWKWLTLTHANLREGHTVLDVASGTGDLAKTMANKVGKEGHVIITDINESMLQKARDRLTDAGLINNVKYILANAEQLPFKNHYFDCITIAFGLRNITHPLAALTSMYRTLKPGGCLLILEFSEPFSFIKKLYDIYSFKVIPQVGKIVTGDKKSYQYLVESIRKHPNQETLKKMMESIGFEDVHYFNFNAGIVALHKGFKY